METDGPHLVQFGTPQPTNGFKRPRRCLQTPSSLGGGSMGESASPSPRPSGHSSLTPDVLEHINGLKHLDDKSILLLLEAARSGDRVRMPGPDRSSMSTLGSRASSYLSVPSSRASMLSDPRSSVASTESSFTHYSTASSRMSTASSRLSTVSSRLSTVSSTSAPKNFACTFCDKALKSKPYWKSHEEEFHEQRLTWRCPDCEQIFHAGKRFREHHTKLHGCENCKQPRESGQPTSRKASPCVKKYEIVMHNKDAWGCGFCGCLLASWEERCEHIAMHFEDKKKKWNFTNVILGLLKQTDVAHSWTRLLTEKHGEPSNAPQLSWESKKCNRLRYKLETKWDTRVFDVDKVVQETYDLADIEPADVVESSTESTSATQDHSALSTDVVDCKMEPLDLSIDQRTSSSHGVSDNAMMDLDQAEPVRSLPHELPHTPWSVAPHLSASTLSSDTNMTSFDPFAQDITHMTASFSQPAVQSFDQAWMDTSFVPTSELVAFPPTNAFVNFTVPPKEVVPVPTSQFTNFGPYPRQSIPPNFLHHSNSTNSRRFVPKLVNISGASHRPTSDQPPPPPPKDDHSNRLSRTMVRRRPSDISQQTMASQRDVGWTDELNWG